MKYTEYLLLIKSDLFRYTGEVSPRIFWRHFRINPGFKFCFWMRTCFYVSQIRFARFFLRPLVEIFYWHYTYKYGISIPYTTTIGSGFYIGHFGGIVVNKECVIGKNCNISHGVTLGQSNRGPRKGCPTIGDNVYIGPGAVIIGNIKAGDFAAIGANCVVTKDVPESAVVVGVPAKVISFAGSLGYINRTSDSISLSTQDNKQ